MPFKGPSTLATLFNHMWPRIVAGIFIPVGNHYFQALASTLQFVAQVCHRLWLVPATDRAFAYITYMSPPHVALVCSGPPQCAATCGWTKWPVCSGPNTDIWDSNILFELKKIYKYSVFWLEVYRSSTSGSADIRMNFDIQIRIRNISCGCHADIANNKRIIFRYN